MARKEAAEWFNVLPGKADKRDAVNNLPDITK
jgi:hypothetical protein